MLVTLALILIMVSMMWGFGSRSNQREQKKACRANLQKIYIALQIYATDHGGIFPRKAGALTSEEPLSQLIPQYTADTSPFICPGSKDRALAAGESFAARRISYAYFMGRHAEDSKELLMTDRQIDARAKPLNAPIFSQTGKPPGNNHHKYGGNYLFCDGAMEQSAALATVAVSPGSNVTLLNPR